MSVVEDQGFHYHRYGTTSTDRGSDINKVTSSRLDTVDTNHVVPLPPLDGHGMANGLCPVVFEHNNEGGSARSRPILPHR